MQGHAGTHRAIGNQEARLSNGFWHGDCSDWSLRRDSKKMPPPLNPDGESKTEIKHAVISYLANHQQAADTLDGIVAWWLPLQRYETARARVEAVLNELVVSGILRRDRLPDGAALYSLSETSKVP
jgi:hypothetical protein